MPSVAAALQAFSQNSSSERVVNEQLWVSQEGLSITDSGSNGNSVKPLQLPRQQELCVSLFKVNIPDRGIHWFKVLGPSSNPSQFMLLCSMFLYLSRHLKIKGLSLGIQALVNSTLHPDKASLPLAENEAVLFTIFTVLFLENSFQLWNFTEIDAFVFFIFFHFCIWLSWNSDLV